MNVNCDSCEDTEIENDFQKKCRKGAKFAAHTAFSAILGEISCLFSLALEFFTRFRGGSFQPLTHLSASDKSKVLGISSWSSDFGPSLGSGFRQLAPASLTPAPRLNFNHSRTSPESSYQPSANTGFVAALGMTSTDEGLANGDF
jgi:hypothetical protein